MDEDDFLKMKQDLEKHIAECNDILLSLDKETFTDEKKSKLKKISDLIKYKSSQTLISMCEERKFIELIDSIPSVAIQGYNKEREVVYWNNASEKIYGYTSSEAFGEKLEDLIIPKEMHEYVVSSINDWYLNGKEIPSGELLLQKKDKTKAHVFSSHVMLGEGSKHPEMFCVDIDLSEITSLRIKNLTLEKKANLDNLTNIYNRQYFESIIDQKIKKIKRHKKELSLIMFDIDFFKKVNDEHGHDVGDKALVSLVEIVKEVVRNEDVLARWGGEEFMLLIETNISQAVNIADKLRKNIDLKTLKLKNVPHLTCSFGIVDMLSFNSFQEAYEKVDEKLYLAKYNGRNRLVY